MKEVDVRVGVEHADDQARVHLHITVAHDASARESVIEAVLTIRSSPCGSGPSGTAGQWTPEQLLSVAIPQNPALDDQASAALARSRLCIPSFVHLLLGGVPHGGGASAKRYRLQ
jgi:hypothetical protein